MSNVVFPVLAGLQFPVKRSPVWKTKKQVSASGKEARTAMWTYPVWNIQMGYEFLRDTTANDELKTLVGFFNARLGMWDDFFFSDPDDKTATDQGFGVGDGTTKTFQLARSYGGWTEPVRGVQSVTNVKVNGSTTVLYSMNINAGTITFTTAPANGALLTWSGVFYWRCRFSDDTNTFEKFMQNLWSAGTIKLVTLK